VRIRRLREIEEEPESDRSVDKGSGEARKRCKAHSRYKGKVMRAIVSGQR
jgi:hypothetical protein